MRAGLNAAVNDLDAGRIGSDRLVAGLDSAPLAPSMA
jgi:hypothetical protein